MFADLAVYKLSFFLVTSIFGGASLNQPVKLLIAKSSVPVWSDGQEQNLTGCVLNYAKVMATLQRRYGITDVHATCQLYVPDYSPTFNDRVKVHWGPAHKAYSYEAVIASLIFKIRNRLRQKFWP